MGNDGDIDLPGAVRPVCFVLMPFGKKKSAAGLEIDFDAVYAEIIKPAVEDAALDPIRADEEQAGGVIHKPMFERLLLCPFAVADLTSANANVFYELGVRHAAKDRVTALIFAQGIEQLPFDVGLLRGMPYALGPNGRPSHADGDRAALAKKLIEARDGHVDSPLYQLVDGYPDVAHSATDVFRDQVEYSSTMKRRLADARAGGLEAVRAVEAELPALEDVELGILVDLMLSYRAVKDGWADVVRLGEAMPRPLRDTVMVLEQRAMALNRIGRSEEAVEILTALIDSRGPSSETYGLLGRVYKDRWDAAKQDGKSLLAAGHLKKAIASYTAGFETDWRDAFPGINAVTLMEVADPPLKDEQARLLPVVRYAVERKIATGRPDYWDHATLLELAVLAGDTAAVSEALSDALPEITDHFMPETTARNLRLIREAREARGEDAAWIAEIEEALIDVAPH